MRPRPLAAALPFFFLSSFGLPAALAQPPAPAPSAPSDEPAKLTEPDYSAIGLSQRQVKILKKAFAAESAGQMEEALELFRKQYYLQPTSPAEAELGLAELRAGHWVVAARRLTHATMDGIFRLNARPIEYLRDKLQEARSHVGTLNVRTNIQGASISIDGEPLDDWPYADICFVTPGKHNVMALRKGYWAVNAETEVRAG